MVGIASWAAVALENAILYTSVQEASRLKDDFLASLSHELRTPLNAILGYARMLRTGAMAPDRQHRAVETIERNATSLTQIVEDVLDISRIVSGKIRLNVQPVVPFKLNDDWKILSRSIVPFIYQEDRIGIGSQSGLGDSTVTLWFSPEKEEPGAPIWGAA